MSITKNDVEKIANLARLNFSEEEKEKFTHQLNSILTYIEKLNEIDTSKVEPLSHVNPLENVFRKDEVKPSLKLDETLKNAPQKLESFFKVPKVINQ